MSTKADWVRGWFLKAESDLSNARRTLASEGPYDTACFHVQQCTEKYLKGFLIFHGHAIPKTHDLEELQIFCVRIDQGLAITDYDLSEMSGYAVEMRYDFEFWPDLQSAEQALKIAEAVRARILDRLPEAVAPKT